MGYVKTIALVIAVLTFFLSMIEPVAAKDQKTKDMEELQESNLIIELNRNDFIKYVLSQNKEYDVLVYYTLSQNCDHCVDIEKELQQVSYSYIKSNKHLLEHTQRPIFFVKIEYNQANSEIFAASGFQSVPIICLANEKLAKKYAKNGDAKYDSKYEWKMSTQDFHDAGKLLEHVNKVTHSDVELKYTLYRIMMGNILIFGIAGVLFFFKDYLGGLLRNKTIWMVGTAIIYIQCIGGIAFNMIHKVPTFKYGHDSTGGMVVEEYFQRNQRSQYAGEGYMASLLMFTIGALMVGYVY